MLKICPASALCSTFSLEPHMSWFSKAGIVILSLTAAASGAQVVENWIVSALDIAPDGFVRNAALVNGIFPGPLMTANKGDQVTVNLFNQLADPAMRRSTSMVRFFVLPFLRVFVDTVDVALAWNCGSLNYSYV